ncbi:hypothetical protein [Noviherbaspirillum malthae]|uniref:hypothetical protein n=1 Tax=Noviherbaspirillum malthae TaxID=1260987 RepID=UPI00188EF492|nr:hypothetical protein [Noviherbaspirillum malthae]
MRYVTYDAAGALTGSFLQDVAAEHTECYIEVDDDTGINWVNFRANEARDGVELLPPVEPVVPTAVPQMVTMRQARLALLGVGLLDDVELAIAAIEDPATKRKAQIEWEFSSEVFRNRELVLMLAPALGLDDAALDALFVEASKL